MVTRGPYIEGVKDCRWNDALRGFARAQGIGNRSGSRKEGRKKCGRPARIGHAALGQRASVVHFAGLRYEGLRVANNPQVFHAAKETASGGISRFRAVFR